jgi:hypothetical protein
MTKLMTLKYIFYIIINIIEFINKNINHLISFNIIESLNYIKFIYSFRLNLFI